MRCRCILPALAAVAVVAAGCAGEPASGPATDDPTGQTTSRAGQDPATPEPTADATTTAGDASTTAPAASSLPDTPQGHLGLTATIGQLPDLPTGDGGVEVVATGPPSQSIVPVVVHNGTDGPVSRVEVSGAVVDGDGARLGSGRSQGFLPPVVEAGGHTFGYVFAGTDQLPDDASLDDPAVDYTEGLGDFENIAALDVTSVEMVGDGVTGEVANPNDVEVTGPVSVFLACFDGGGQLAAVLSGYADRDQVPAGETSTFTLPLYGQSLPCDTAVAAASGYVEMSG